MQRVPACTLFPASHENKSAPVLSPKNPLKMDAKVMHLMANHLIEVKQYHQAIPHLIKAKEAYVELKDDATLSQVLLDLGRAHIGQEDTGAAIDYLMHAVTLFSEQSKIDTKMQHDFALTLYTLGKCLKKQGLNVKARNCFVQAQEKFNVLHRGRDAALSSLQVGIIDCLEGRFETALDFLRDAFIHGHQLKDENIVMLANEYLGIIHLKQDNIDSALLCLNEVYLTYSKIKSYVDQATVGLALSLCYLKKENTVLAEKYAKNALVILLQLKTAAQQKQAFAIIHFHLKDKSSEALFAIPALHKIHKLLCSYLKLSSVVHITPVAASTTHELKTSPTMTQVLSK